jgi:hypothetical protein
MNNLNRYLKMNKFKQFLNRAYWTLDGWRFEDLKRFISTQLINTNQRTKSLEVDGALLTYAIQQLSFGKNNGEAFLSIMPPTESGVAICNIKTLTEGKYEGDIFGDWNSVEGWLQSAAYHDNGLSSRYSISSFPFFLYQRRYKRVVASFGNSDSDFVIVDSAIKCQPVNFAGRFSVHLHDVCLWNLCRLLSISQGVSLEKLICHHYPEANTKAVSAVFESSTTDWQISESLLSLGMYGLRPIIANLNPSDVFVNSAAAECIVISEYKNHERKFLLKRSFHPVFKGDIRRSELPIFDGLTPLRIGTFGILSYSKRSDVVLEACEHLAGIGQNVTLVIAGFEAQKFLERYNLASFNFKIECYSSPTDGDLLSLMDTVHVAVQLRKRNLGESSGVVASLICKGVTTIVSNVGSFAEYDGAAIVVEDLCTAVDLANTISKSISIDISSCQSKYISDYTSEKLCQVFSD